MKLNNHGWSFEEMLILMFILIVALLVVVFFIYRLYNNLEKMKYQNNQINENENVETPIINKNNYEELELKLKNSAVIYLKNYYDEILPNTMIITLDTLKNEGIISNIIDPVDNTLCDGYVRIEYDGITNYSPFIQCHNYVTDGY